MQCIYTEALVIGSVRIKAPEDILCRKVHITSEGRHLHSHWMQP